MSDDFYPFVDSGDPTPSNVHLTGEKAAGNRAGGSSPSSLDTTSAMGAESPLRAARISVYDDMLSTPRVIVVEQNDVRTYLEDVTNTVYRTMKEQGGHLTLMIIRELVENFIHARFSEPIISILDNGDTIRFSDQGPGIGDKELAFEFGVTSADREQKRYIRGTGSGLPMIQQYVENAGGAISIEDNLGAGTVVTVSVNPERVGEIEQSVSRGAAVRSGGRGGAVDAPASGMTAPDMTMADAMEPSMQPGGYPANMAASIPGGAYPQTSNMQYMARQGGMPQTGYPAPYGAPVMPSQQMPGMQVGVQGMPATQPGMYPQPYPAGYPQFGNQFSTIPQQYVQPAGMYPQQQPARMSPGAADSLYISERGLQALRFICENASGGPTDLTRAHGSSNGTWSRELATLSKAGLVHKPGQKYVLTDMGRAWLAQHDQ